MLYLFTFKRLNVDPMLKICCLLATIILLSCRTSEIYIVRHAEKEVNTMSSDVPLSAAGKERAEALRTALLGKKIKEIYSTPFIRTTGTAQPLATALSLPILQYKPGDTSFFTGVRTSKNNILIVGHSNTVDDLVNQLSGYKYIPSDLPDTQYGDLFILKKKGKSYKYSVEHFGK
jgi:2,3-bisphosphoglycerate-dependent phosphoglycerate mutase